MEILALLFLLAVASWASMCAIGEVEDQPTKENTDATENA